MIKLAVKIRVIVEVYPTEEEERVLQAIKNVVSYNNLEQKKVTVLGNNTKRIIFEGLLISLSKLKTKIAIKRIQEHVRNFLLKNTTQNSSYLFLNKQAAYAGNVALCETRNESPLGPITIELIAEDSDELYSAIVWLTEG